MVFVVSDLLENGEQQMIAEHEPPFVKPELLEYLESGATIYRRNKRQSLPLVCP